MTGGRVTFMPSGRSDYLLLVLLTLAFVAGAFKVWSRQPAANFASVSAPGLPVGPAAKDVSKAARLPEVPSPDGRFNLSAQFVSAAPGQAVHAASLVELANGDLRAVWFSGSREGAGDVTVQTAVMDAASLRWGAESTLINRRQMQRGLWRYVKKLGNPVIARAPDGSLSLWMVNVSLGGWAGSAITWARSTDEGTTWSRPRRLVTSPFLNISTLVKSAPVPLASGEMLLPVYHEFATKFGEILRLDLRGRVADKIRIPQSRTSLQPVMLITGNTTAQVYMRSAGEPKLMSSASADAGKEWSPAHSTSWPNPDSAVAGVVTRAGAQWLAVNPTAAGRESLSLLVKAKDDEFAGAQSVLVESSPKTPLSIDEFGRLLEKELLVRGVTQQQIAAYVSSATRQLCSAASCSPEFSYPYLLQGRDGYLNLVYTWNRTRIKHVRFDPLQSSFLPVAVPAGSHAPAN